MRNYPKIFALLLTLGLYISCCGQSKANLPTDSVKSETEKIVTAPGPNSITRNIIQDKKGNIWMAAFDGIFRYDGKSFTNVAAQVSKARFFSILADRKGNLWFGSIGSGVYCFDGKSFRNFTIKGGLLNNEVTCIYEDQAGDIWFGVGGGASRYDGKSFQNFIIEGDGMKEDHTGKSFATRPPYEVTSIIEDRADRFWIATRNNTFVYDGKTFTVFAHENIPFRNVRSIIEDKKGNIWLGGTDGLWRYDGNTFTNFTSKFVGHIIEDKHGNIWTSSERDDSKIWTGPQKDNKQPWALSRYDEKTLLNTKPTVTEISYKEMFFGILEANDESIWFGALDGVYCYDGITIDNFKGDALNR